MEVQGRINSLTTRLQQRTTSTRSTSKRSTSTRSTSTRSTSKRSTSTRSTSTRSTSTRSTSTRSTSTSVRADDRCLCPEGFVGVDCSIGLILNYFIYLLFIFKMILN